MDAHIARAIFLYNEETGNLHWRKKSSQMMPGSVAGSVSVRGYVTIRFNKKVYPAHRIVWLIHHGEWPKSDIDHINRLKTDNRIENLREASKSENQRNHSLSKRNTSGYKNVIRSHDLWEVVLTINGNKTRFGSYADIELADLVAIGAREKYYGDFCCHK